MLSFARSKKNYKRIFWLILVWSDYILGMAWYGGIKSERKIFKAKKKFGTIYDLFYHNVFCNSYAEYLEKKHTLFGDLDCKKFLEDFFKVEL